METKRYLVTYADSERIAFKETISGKVTIEAFGQQEELPELEGLLETGDIWEIISAHSERRVWKRVIFLSNRYSEYA